MTTIETTTYAVRINKSNIDGFKKALKTSKLPANHIHTTSDSREMVVGDFVINVNITITLEPGGTDNLNFSRVLMGVYSKANFKKHFGTPERDEDAYIIANSTQEV